MRKFRSGDTLIEVLFAFAILATITGFAFTGAMQGHKASVQAQNQTQALFVAQYHADGLKTYRDSIDWEGDPSQFPSFLDGYTTVLPDMRQYINVGEFCMKTTTGTPPATAPLRWVVSGDCSTELSAMAPNLKKASVKVTLSDPQPAAPAPIERVTATVTVTYDIPNANADGVVTNTILLTKDQQ